MSERCETYSLMQELERVVMDALMTTSTMDWSVTTSKSSDGKLSISIDGFHRRKPPPGKEHLWLHSGDPINLGEQ